MASTWRPGMSRRGWAGGRGAVVALTLLAGALRFSTLSVQRFWPDEAVTAALVRLDFHDMLTTIPASESTPPLYYVFAWVWARLFGYGEFGLRSLSALVGTLTVPVVYAAAGALCSRRVAVLTAALASVSPWLVWYSQEARSYALVGFLSALSLLWFARALGSQPRTRPLVWWAIASELALATHYFAAFVVVPEAIGLLAAWRPRRVPAAATGVLLALAGALVPLALHQKAQGHLAFLAGMTLGTRLADVPKKFLVGETGIYVAHLFAVGVALVAVAGVVGLMAADREERRRALVPATIAGVAVAAPVALAALGSDYVLARNFIVAWPAVAIVVAAGLGARRAGAVGLAAVVALCAYSAGVVVAVPFTHRMRREALTARIVGSRHNDITARLTFVPVEGAGPSRGSVSCPHDYRALGGGAAWINGKAGPAGLQSAPDLPRRGWRARLRRKPSDSSVYEVYAVCVRS